MQTKERHREYELARYHERKALALKILGGKCVKCGVESGLEIDHIDPSQKSFSISNMWGVSKRKFLNELAKCQLLCKEHHKEKHSKREHGTYNMYKRGKCRCSLCRKANAEYTAKYRSQYGRKRG